MNYSVLKGNSLLHTTKRNPEKHEIGLREVRELVERRSGELTILEKDDLFMVHILI